MRVLVTSIEDTASQTIAKVLHHDYKFKETGDLFEGNPVYQLDESTILITINQDMIHSGYIEDHFDAEVFIYCSRHRAASGKPALLVHSTGNFGPQADFGGNPKQLSVSAPSLVSTALKNLQNQKIERNLNEFDVTMEVTHHGPTSMNTPLLFVELGSDEKYWHHEDGARAVAAAVMDCVKEPLTGDASIGFGGTHYASKFNKLVLEKDITIGHIAPKYALNEITSDVVSQMLERSAQKITQAIIDWKGTNAENKAVLFPILEDLGIPVVRASKL
ncbi:MAG: D-aminoacyl-tRNA deacylase [Candidatus Thorarchaeota archaeon]|jgi:D-aminoacyl-tRNA deacylase